MSCQVGRNIYQLRKKNRELLDQLESNSVLLENKIKGLRNTTRTPVRTDNVNNDVLASSTRRKHEMWNARNNSSRVAASTLIKTGSVCPQFSYDNGSNDYENVAEKSRICSGKKIPTKRIRQNAHVSKSGIKKKNTGQPKEKVQSSLRETGVTECYCSNVYSKHTHPGKSLKSPRRFPSKNVEHFKSSKYSKSSKNRGTQTNDRNTLFSKSKNLSDVCSKCIGASHLLNYSPQSKFLRRMKDKLQKFGNEPFLKKQSEISQLCNCDNTQVRDSDSTSTHSHLVSHLRSATESIHLIEDANIHNIQVDDNINSGICETDNDKANHAVKTYKPRSVGFEKKSKEQIGNASGDIPVEHIEKLDKYTEAESKSKESVTEENSRSRILSAKSSTVEGSKKCQCKKEVGGLCCCEVACVSNCGTHTPHDDASFSGPLKSENATEVGQSASPDCRENKTELNMHNKIQCIGYDVISGLIDNDRKMYAADPCTQQLEELSHFRQKHWFDCHAHPHGATTSESRPDSKECRSHISWHDGEPMQPTKDPCIRSFRLNQRLFPEMLAEVHGTECCFAGRSGSASSLLLPTERRLVTLPTVPQTFPEGTCETAKTPSGMQSFPKSNVVIHDPTFRGVEHKQTRKETLSKHRSRQPVPSNSLALRFQKGIA